MLYYRYMGNAFSDILDKVQDAFGGIGKSVDTVVGVDIGSSAVKVVQLKKEGGKIVLQTYGEVATGPYADKKAGELPNLNNEQLAVLLPELITESNVTAKTASFSIQSSASLLFVLSVPQMNDRELANVIPTEARKYIPIPIDEVSLDYWPIPEQEYTDADTSHKKREALVVAIRKETISQYNDIIKSSGFTSPLLEIEVFSAIRSTFNHELQPVVLVDFGASSTRVAVVEYGVVKTFHTINRGSHYFSQSLATSLNIPFEEAEALKKKQGLTQGDNNEAYNIVSTGINYIFSEINNVLLEYERTYHRSLGKMVCIGGGARMLGLYERMQQEFQVPIEMGNPFAKANHPEFLQDILKESGPEFAIALGLALKQLQ